MHNLVVLLFCIYQYLPVEGLQLAPYEPLEWERPDFLRLAVGRGDAALIGFIHKHNPGAWARHGAEREHRSTMLHAAATRSNPLVMRALIALGMDVNARDISGRTPLHIAANSDRTLEATFELLDAGAEVDAATPEVSNPYARLSMEEYGTTPLMTALRNSASNTVTELINAGADRSKILTRYPQEMLSVPLIVFRSSSQYVGTNLVMLAKLLGAVPVSESQRKHYQCHKSVLAEADYRSPFLGSTVGNSTDSLFRTSLHKECTYDTHVPSHLVFERDIFRRTPLHTAVLRRDANCVEQLLQFGADVEALDWLDRTPLHIATFCGFTEIETLLLNATTVAPQQREEGVLRED